MYADDSTIYAPATTTNEVIETLNKELQSVLEWVASNKLVLNISKTKSIVFGTNHFLSARPQLNLVMNGVVVEQVEKTKLLGITLDYKLSKHIDSMVVKMGRGLSITRRYSAFLTPHSKKKVLQALVLSNLDYCLVMWSSAARKDLVKLQLAQNRAACFALHCNQRANIDTIHASLSWLIVEERLTASLLFI